MCVGPFFYRRDILPSRTCGLGHDNCHPVSYVTAIRALLEGVADRFDAETPSLQVVIVTLLTEEFSVAQSAEGSRGRELATCQGSFGFDEIGAVQAFTGETGFTLAGMMMIIPFVAVVAEVRLVEESSEGIASVVMVIFLDESDDLTRRHGGVSHKSQHVRGSMDMTLI